MRATFGCAGHPRRHHHDGRRLGRSGFLGRWRPATQATFNTTYSVAVDGNGNLYIADRFNDRIRMVDPTGTITTIAGTGATGGTGDGGPGTQASFSVISSICLDGNGNLYITDQYSEKVRKLAPDGTITSVAGSGGLGFYGDGGPALSANMQSPAGVVVDGKGNIFVSDSLNQRVRRVDSVGDHHDRRGQWQCGLDGDGGPGTMAALTKPLGLALDANGNVYIADNENGRVRIVSPDGMMKTFAGTGIKVGDGGPAISARLSRPTAVAIDARETCTSRTPASSESDRWLPTARSPPSQAPDTGETAASGPATEVTLNSAPGVAVGPHGEIYIADDVNSVIRMVDPSSGQYLEYCGQWGHCRRDLRNPSSVAADAAGDVYCDSGVVSGA